MVNLRQQRNSNEYALERNLQRYGQYHARVLLPDYMQDQIDLIYVRDIQEVLEAALISGG